MDSVVEVLRGQRLAAAVAGVVLAVLLVATLAPTLQAVSTAGLTAVNAEGNNVVNLGRILFTDYLFPFELTSALLITAALAGMVLAFSERAKQGRLTQRKLVEARIRGGRPSPLPGPGVFATSNSVATPALLPDGSVAEDSLFDIIEATKREQLGDARRVAAADSDLGARGLRGPVAPSGSHQETPEPDQDHTPDQEDGR